MANDTSDIWAWTYVDEQRLLEEGGAKRAIIEYYHEFWSAYDHDFAAAEMAINNALEAARATGEIRWELHLRHWRLQLWLNDDLKRVLPEAIDLLNLATDERVRDVPQRICAYHDIVECYVNVDPKGYAEEIVENAQDVLAQLPTRHPCATCARSNLARAAGATGRVDDAKRWIAQTEATLTQRKYASLYNNFGTACELLAKWDDAERYYLQALKLAREAQKDRSYLEALLGVARARIGLGNLQGAVEILREARQWAKNNATTAQLARLQHVEGCFAEAHKVMDVALDHFTQAARVYNDLGYYRDAAVIGLHAAEMAREAGLKEPEEALTVAARAAGELPEASRDVHERLAALGRQPIAPSPGQIFNLNGENGDAAGEKAQSRKELETLEGILQSHIANGNIRDTAAMLYRVGLWHDKHNEQRAAIDYFIWSALLERLMRRPIEEREDAIGRLAYAREHSPAGAVDAAFAVVEREVPALLNPLLGEISTALWSWLVRAVAAESAGEPVVEPEPEPGQEDGRAAFQSWLDHNVSMTVLLVRFRDQIDPAQCADWFAYLDDVVRSMEEQAGNGEGGQEILSLVRALAALSQGASIEETLKVVLPPFDQIIQQIGALSQEPIWRHPGGWPFDFMIEDAAQKAVRALRLHDEHRPRRLANLALRYRLMTIDLYKENELQSLARFLEILAELVLAEGAMPAIEPPLRAPFSTILTAIHNAAASTAATSAE